MKPDNAPAALHQMFERQRQAALVAPFPTWPERADRLKRLQLLLQTHEVAMANAIDADFGGRPAIETELAEVFPSLAAVKDALHHGKAWMKPRRGPVAKWFLPARAQLLPQPLGVVGIIVPWNYPLFLAAAPLAAALVAGNRVLIKMSEFTPTFSELFATLVAQHFSADEVQVVTGGADVAAQFSALPLDHLLFTGSTMVGRKVMAAAAANLTPVTLELGGKSPAVITPGYPLDHAVQRIMMGKLLNAGQTCIAPDYVLLPRDQIEPFISAAREFVAHSYGQGLAAAHYCSVVNPRQYARLTGLLDQASAQGQRVECLFSDDTRDGARDDARHRLAPHLVVDVQGDGALMQDELFGPLLPLVPYERTDDALAFINARARPLALYWFDHDSARTAHALQHTHAGGVTVNDTLLHVAQDGLPFGGVGASGMGHYHGRWGFETFSKIKPVLYQSRLNGMKLFLPPYSPLMRRMLGWMKRF
jgi:coniferyl-aldehyde dehydrogenase